MPTANQLAGQWRGSPVQAGRGEALLSVDADRAGQAALQVDNVPRAYSAHLTFSVKGSEIVGELTRFEDLYYQQPVQTGIYFGPTLPTRADFRAEIHGDIISSAWTATSGFWELGLNTGLGGAACELHRGSELLTTRPAELKTWREFREWVVDRSEESLLFRGHDNSANP